MCNFGVGKGLYYLEGSYYVLIIDSFLEPFDWLLHFLGCLDIRKCFEVDESPYLILNEFCF